MLLAAVFTNQQQLGVGSRVRLGYAAIRRLVDNLLIDDQDSTKRELTLLPRHPSQTDRLTYKIKIVGCQAALRKRSKHTKDSKLIWQV